MSPDPSQSTVPPRDQRDGATPNYAEDAQPGDWIARATEGGIVSPEEAGSDAPGEMLGEDPELGNPVFGVTTGSDEPATETGVDLSGGDNADATSGGRAE